MKKEILTACLAMLLLAVSAAVLPEVRAEESEKPDWVPDLSAEVAFESKYIWRGQNLVDNFVVQPGGSGNDYQSIEACNEAGATMVYTGERSFKH